MKIKNAIIATIITIGIISGGAFLAINHNKKLEENPPQSIPDKKDPVQNDDKEPDKGTIPDDSTQTEEEGEDQEDEKKPVVSNPDTSKPNKPGSSTGNKPNVPSKPQEPSEPNVPENPDVPEKPTEPDKPVNPDQPTEPDTPELVDAFKVTNSMVENGVVSLKNKKYGTLIISSDIEKNVRITLEDVEVTTKMTLEKPNNYQLDVVNSKINSLEISADTPTMFARLFRSKSLFQMNKALEGPTVNFGTGSTVQDIAISGNVEINGTSKVANIQVTDGTEVVLNIPSENVTLNTNGTVNINNSVTNLTNNGSNSTIVVTSNVENFVNESSSSIRISSSSNITNFENRGNNSTVSGNGTITNAKISANDTLIYAEVINKPELDTDVDNVLIRKENDITLTDVHSTSQSSVTFTLSKATKLTLNDVSVICTKGKSISLFNLTTKDDMTYTLSTSYYKNDSYELYITLPNGNIISREFDTDYANPTVNKVVIDRISNTEATLEMYGVDEGGILYYMIEDASARGTFTPESIKANGKSERVKVGYNSVGITNLEEGKSYNLYYVIEGYFNNTSAVKGPFEITNQVTEPSTSEYQIVYAAEEITNRFVFKLNKAPKKALTLQDFEIICPQESNLTTKNAKFTVSPDLLTYILVVPDNYGHKDNKYRVKIDISDTESIESSFVSHFDPPVIRGAVDNVTRPNENSASLSFNSDEAGMIYYGVYEWNGAIYDYNSTTPFASDVLTGAISSKQQKLHEGPNTLTVDLTGITVTNNTRLWALFVDDAGNYRVGFVDHYKIPAYVNPEEPDPSGSTLKITNFEVKNNKSISIDFNEAIGWITSDDIELSVVQDGSLPSKILYSINNDIPNHLSIELLNHVLTTGEYQLTIRTIDKDEKNVTLTKKFTVN